ncbi:MAG: hypothetical protein ACREDS_10200 [Limisphaerales bacterium]
MRFVSRTIAGLCKLQLDGVSALQVALEFFRRNKRTSAYVDFAMKFAGRQFGMKSAKANR